MKQLLQTLLILIFFLPAFAVFSQDSTAAKKSTGASRSYSIAIDYGTNRAYNGRTVGDSKQSYISPSFTYTAPSGFFANASTYKIIGDSIVVDELDLGAGYDFMISKKTKGSVSFTRSFFNANSTLLNSQLPNVLDFYFKHPLFKVLRTKVAFDYSFGNSRDFSVTWKNYYPIYWEDVFKNDDEIALKPTIITYLGTQNYYVDFYNRAIVQRKRKGKLEKLTPKQQAELDKQKSKFQFTGFYFSLPLTYTIGVMYFEAATNYSISVNQPKFEAVPPSFSFTFTVGADF